MKKICSLLLTFTILSSAFAIPVFAENNRLNNYRTTAATDGNDMDWGWLGLLGLAGLFGLRNRDRERT
ncbi:WGxxGxxG family protein [Paenibacillus harenae]|uniref:WGxxGxxG family protein n=1 Tax=Paenibacillus harenae TaxID=306543 RepID=UPI00048F9106|nr:WGxxGxxG family protein [Paenibacillus harenae]